MITCPVGLQPATNTHQQKTKTEGMPHGGIARLNSGPNWSAKFGNSQKRSVRKKAMLVGTVWWGGSLVSLSLLPNTPFGSPGGPFFCSFLRDWDNGRFGMCLFVLCEWLKCEDEK